MPLLNAFTSEEQSGELIFPRKRPLDTPPQRMDGGVESPLTSALGTLAVAGVLCDVGDHTGIENARAMVDGITAAIEIAISTSAVQPGLCGHLLQCFQALREQNHVRLVDGSHGDKC